MCATKRRSIQVEHMSQRLTMRRDVKYCVYTHSANGEVFYVGQGSLTRPFMLSARNHDWADYVQALPSYDITIVGWTNDHTEARQEARRLLTSLKPYCNRHTHEPIPRRGASGFRATRVRIAAPDFPRIEAMARTQNKPRSCIIRQLFEIAITNNLLDNLAAKERNAAMDPALPLLYRPQCVTKETTIGAEVLATIHALATQHQVPRETVMRAMITAALQWQHVAEVPRMDGARSGSRVLPSR